MYAVPLLAGVIMQPHRIGLNVLALRVSQSELSAADVSPVAPASSIKSNDVVVPARFKLPDVFYAPVFAGGKDVLVSDFFAACFRFCSRHVALSRYLSLFMRQTSYSK